MRDPNTPKVYTYEVVYYDGRGEQKSTFFEGDNAKERANKFYDGLPNNRYKAQWQVWHEDINGDLQYGNQMMRVNRGRKVSNV